MQNPNKRHMEAKIIILHYLKFAQGRGIMFSKNNYLNVEGHTNAYWVEYFTFVRGNLITWRSKKQKVVVAIKITCNLVQQHDHTKHIVIDSYFIKQNLDEKIIRFPFVQFKNQLAGMLTKVVASRVFHNLLDKLSIKKSMFQFEGECWHER
ncbi:hypothetical protein CR513_01199, partial [Mucuna pruriens]